MSAESNFDAVNAAYMSYEKVFLALKRVAEDNPSLTAIEKAQKRLRAAAYRLYCASEEAYRELYEEGV